MKRMGWVLISVPHPHLGSKFHPIFKKLSPEEIWEDLKRVTITRLMEQRISQGSKSGSRCLEGNPVEIAIKTSTSPNMRLESLNLGVKVAPQHPHNFLPGYPTPYHKWEARSRYGYGVGHLVPQDISMHWDPGHRHRQSLTPHHISLVRNGMNQGRKQRVMQSIFQSIGRSSRISANSRPGIIIPIDVLKRTKNTSKPASSRVNRAIRENTDAARKLLAGTLDEFCPI